MASERDIKPALVNWDGMHGLPDFASIEDCDFRPAFAPAMALHLAEIEAIADNPHPADYANTIDAMELAGSDLRRLQALFWHRAGTDSTPVIQELERDIGPELAKHQSAIFMNEHLFARIDALHEDRNDAGLTSEQIRVLEQHHKRFVKQGAKLAAADKQKLAEIDQRLAALAAEFGQNVLADEKDWILVLDTEDDLAGLPESLVAAMAEAAAQRGHNGKHAVTLSRSIIEPFLMSSSRPDLRQTAFDAWAARGQNGGDSDNTDIVAETLKLRAEKAELLGYDSFAALKLDGTMAKQPQAVQDLLGKVWPAAKASAADHGARLAEIAAEEGHNEPLKASDWRYYTARLREREFDLDEAIVKPYLQLENMIQAAFDVAGRLFGLSFAELADVAGPHPDARVFEVRDRAGDIRAVFVGDYFARSSKRSGAWMSMLQKQHRLDGGQHAIVFNVMNFAKPAQGSPALLSLDDARTLFHEFGHALHGMLSDVTYPSISGTSVARDFVELPSQLYEHWLTVPEILHTHALHMETGEAMPQALLDKVLAARTFNAGFDAIEYTSSAIVDMRFHQGSNADHASADPIGFEADVLAELGMPDAIVMRHRTPHFLHVFYGDGYAAGYYSYMWSEVLDADAFNAFEEASDPFDPELAKRLHQHIYSSGDSVDPEVAYTAFRGQMPTADAMLRKRGLAA
ncbi:MAG: M3 family metallopeptidase [Pseudomonadota bacterium]